MTSKAQILANRRNALASTGPKTLEGKKKASLNALKHGLCSPKLSLVQDETAEELGAFHHRLYQHLAPQDPLEEVLVERIISQAWRLRRIIRIERDIFVVGQVDAYETGDVKLGFAFARDARVQQATDTLARYERHIEASLYRNLEALAAMRRTDETKPSRT